MITIKIYIYGLTKLNIYLSIYNYSNTLDDNYNKLIFMV